MKRRQRCVLFVLERSSESLKVLGDMIFIIWLIEISTPFEPVAGYWFKGWYGCIATFLCYVVGLLCHIAWLGLSGNIKK